MEVFYLKKNKKQNHYLTNLLTKFKMDRELYKYMSHRRNGLFMLSSIIFC